MEAVLADGVHYCPVLLATVTSSRPAVLTVVDVATLSSFCWRSLYTPSHRTTIGCGGCGGGGGGGGGGFFWGGTRGASPPSISLTFAPANVLVVGSGCGGRSTAALAVCRRGGATKPSSSGCRDTAVGRCGLFGGRASAARWKSPLQSSQPLRPRGVGGRGVSVRIVTSHSPTLPPRSGFVRVGVAALRLGKVRVRKVNGLHLDGLSSRLCAVQTAGMPGAQDGASASEATGSSHVIGASGATGGTSTSRVAESNGATPFEAAVAGTAKSCSATGEALGGTPDSCCPELGSAAAFRILQRVSMAASSSSRPGKSPRERACS
ncbi:uncharacterized protein LOC126195780 [Schistocerca nitens]|uniref:uncharacterized protein LOC126195780 n=1 Tax=Schistocerca nitens TaxID=7011 RepID=UPI002119A719|nr:uncharacterized protein LOC126195780 [Schistocerca nitens]